ncbi:MAG: GGDEF domain-containing protein [Pirellulales bacterium]|nr:GGDEF domain-containing protein [Pirellulales bacterium]
MVDSTTNQYTTTAAAAVPPESSPYAKRQELLQELMGDSELLLKNRLEVRHLMSRRPVTVLPTATLAEMTDLMRHRRLHHLLVCGHGGELVGVVSDRDLCSTQGTTAQQLMTYPPRTCASDTPLNAAITFLINEHISCLPVVDQGNLRGVLTTTDLVLTLQCTLQLWMRLAQVLLHDQTWDKKLTEIAAALDGEMTAEQLGRSIDEARTGVRRLVQDLVNGIDLYADVLTGIGNRRELEDVLDVMLGIGKRFGRTFSLAIATVDHFERIRTSCGEDVVRALLRTVARMIEESTRQGDFIARLRDDAFAVVLAETDLEKAQEFATRLQEAARENKQLDVELRITAGAVEARAEDDVLRLLERAEAALPRMT